MEIDPRRLRVLHEVARRGGVVRAAEAMHLTASAVSQQLALLEREVGLALIDRSQRKASLTPAGQVLAGYAERIEEELAEARRELTRFTGRLSGPVSVAAFPTVIRHLLVPALDILAERHPRIAPRIVELYGPPALRELRLGGVDLVVTEHDADDPGPAQPSLHSHRVYVDEYRIVAPPGWAEVPDDVAELGGVPWVAGHPDQACGRALERLAALHGFTPRRVHVIEEFPPTLALVAAGHGVAIVPSLALLEVPAGEAVVTGIPGVGARRIDAVTRVSRTRSGEPDPVQAVVIAALREAADGLAARLGEHWTPRWRASPAPGPEPDGTRAEPVPGRGTGDPGQGRPQ
ncbi:LysR family transcriptional regulator [Planomonospora venezuelensis]|uniref:DNA-binding transcriptional LysR family regulator n=1 Tax=Planomonospora venezuelensis TaxID=1999 RepID=A0A841CWJ3_PLAVE|nr:LysR family transcriptional regulator [Planomonospora venezuelensis]MBB5961679.1 DNA-binding transcriptional LysR family regulator [Planomonospora venezuelensis]GIM98825.1 LysR family transcriptional regulator [Planomonospora venezuelensis]